MPRVAPITGTSDGPAEHHAVVDAVTRVFGTVRGPFGPERCSHRDGIRDSIRHRRRFRSIGIALTRNSAHGGFAGEAIGGRWMSQSARAGRP